MSAVELSPELQLLCRQMASLARSGGFVVDLDAGRCLWCAEEVARIHGLTIDACATWLAAGRDDLGRIDEADRPHVRALLDAARRHGRPYTVEYRLRTAAGGLLWLGETGEVVRDAASGTRRLVATICDRTAQREVEETLRRANERLEQRVAQRTAELLAAKEAAEQALREAKESTELFLAAAESLVDGLAIYDEDDRLMYCNRRYPELASPAFAAALRIGARFEDVVRAAAAAEGGMYHPSMGEDFVTRRLAERGARQGDRELRMADGRWVRVRESAVPGVGRVVLSHDVTDRKRALDEAAESEQRWRAIAESVPLPLVIARIEEPEILFANALATETFGVRPGHQPDAIGAVYVDPGDRKRLVERVQAEQRVDAFEVQLRRRDGRTLWALLSARVLSFDGRPAMLAAATDITARKAVEHALRESEARLAAFMEHAPLGMYLKDLDGRYLMANPEMSKVFRVDARTMIGRTFFECPGGRESAPWVVRCDAEVLRTGRVLVVEDQTNNPDTYRWDLVIRFPIRDEGNAITHIGGFDVDISERKAMEEALKTSEQRFRVLAEAHPVPLIIVGVEDAIFMFASPACEPLFGVPVAELVGHSILPYYVDPRDRQEIMARVRRDGGLDDYEVQMRRRDGTPFWTAFTSRLITFEGKAAVVAAFLDLTEKKKAQAELERQREALHQSDKMTAFGSLLASVAHELNNPLSVVVGQSAMLVELAADPASAERAHKIRAAADRCARIVRTFLAMARSRPPERRDVQLNEVVRSALDLAAYGLRSTGVQIDLALAPDLPTLWADGDQLHQIVANLIINAKQAMQSCPPPRRLELSTWHDEAGRAVVLEVADSGPGIPAEMHERIFDPFFTTKPSGIGTGIGLSVSKRIVAAHGGEIRVGGRTGGGAHLTVRLPLTTRIAGVSAAPPAVPHRAGPRAVLVVDDEPDVGAVLAEILRIDGLRVDVASGGRAALARLREQDYDLVISDLRMPDLDGPGLYRELGRLRPRMLERVMFVTGDTLSADASEFLAASGAPVIDKPFDAGRVRRLAAEHLERLAQDAGHASPA